MTQYEEPRDYALPARQLSVLWDVHCPSDIRDALLPDLVVALPLVAPWCKELLIKWQSVDDDRSSSMTLYARPEYRWARITIYPAWRDEPIHMRQATMLHEIIHIALEPLCDAARQAAFVAEEAHGKELGKVLADIRTAALEQSVSDLVTVLGYWKA